MKSKAAQTIEVSLLVNGEQKSQSVPLEMTLQEFLHHRLKQYEVRRGCSEGVCGTCTVLWNGEPICSCLKMAVQAQNAEIITEKGLQNHAPVLYEALVNNIVSTRAFQCGYCAPGMLVSAISYLKKNPNSTIQKIRKNLAGNLCRCTGYQQIWEAVQRTAEEKTAMKTTTAHLDLRPKLTSEAAYPSDIRISSPLIGKILWSAWSSAKIVSMDTSEALKIPGVEAIVTYKEIPGKNKSGLNTFFNDCPLLASDCVKSLSDPVALVAAQTETAAREALEKIKVVYKPTPAVHDLLTATQPTAPRVRKRSNFIGLFTEIHGDADRILQESDTIVEGTYFTSANDHACLELEGGTGWYDGDTLVLSISCQSPYNAQKAIARALKISHKKIRIIAPRMGGAFGKYLTTSIEAHLALLVFKTRQPVQLLLGREEGIKRAPKRHSFAGHYKLGMDKEGHFLALKADVYADAGPYVSMTPAVVSLFAVEARGAYAFPNLHVVARGVLTNNLITAPMRGFGTQQIAFGIESIVEKAAHVSGISPDELRLKNFLTTMPDGRGNEIPNPKIMLSQTLNWVEKALGARPKPISNWKIGRGISTTHAKYGFPFGFVDSFVGHVYVNESGQFFVSSEIPDAGTGAPRGLLTLVAKKFGLLHEPLYVHSQKAFDDATGALLSKGKRTEGFKWKLFNLIETIQTASAGVLQINLAKFSPKTYASMMGFFAPVINIFLYLLAFLKGKIYPFSPDSFLPRIGGSRSFLMAGRAVLNAAELLEQKAINLAANHFENPTTAFKITAEGVVHTSLPQRNLSWGTLAKLSGGVLEGVATARLPKGKLLAKGSGNQVGPVDFMDGTHGCDIAIHPKTGQVRILNYVACHDVGFIHNPEVIRGQIIGGVAMGISQALMEKIYQEKGVVKNQGLHEYLIPSMLDVPSDIKIKLLESGGGLGPFGAKGIGEAAAVAAPNTIINAIYDALGKQPQVIPFTPEDIVELITS